MTFLQPIRTPERIHSRFRRNARTRQCHNFHYIKCPKLLPIPDGYDAVTAARRVGDVDQRVFRAPRCKFACLFE